MSKDRYRDIDAAIAAVAEARPGSTFAELLDIIRDLKVFDPKTDFRFSDWTGIDFTGCDLSNCDFSGAILNECNFSNAHVNGAIFQKVVIGSEYLRAFKYEPTSLRPTKPGGRFSRISDAHLQPGDLFLDLGVNTVMGVLSEDSANLLFNSWDVAIDKLKKSEAKPGRFSIAVSFESFDDVVNFTKHETNAASHKEIIRTEDDYKIGSGETYLLVPADLELAPISIEDDVLLSTLAHGLIMRANTSDTASIEFSSWRLMRSLYY